MERDTGTSNFQSSFVVWEDGTIALRFDYDYAVRRLNAYENSGVQPEDAGTGRCRKEWERYTVKVSNGEIFPRRGWECVLGQLRSYEQSRLTPEQWMEKYGTGDQNIN